MSGAAGRRAVAARGENEGEAQHKDGRQGPLCVGAGTRAHDQRLLAPNGCQGVMVLGCRSSRSRQHSQASYASGTLSL